MNCFNYQLRISQALDNHEDLPESLQLHIGKCDNCKRFYRAAAELDQRLSRSPKLPKQFNKRDFTQKIAAQLDHVTQKQCKIKLPQLILIRRAAIVLLAISAAVLFSSIYSKTAETVTPPNVIFAKAPTQAIINWSIKNIIETDRVEISNNAAQKFYDNSLGKEYQALLADADSVYRHVLACTPGGDVSN